MKFLREHRSELFAIAAIAGLYGVMFLLGITCPIKWVSGVSCPGCGMSRAWMRVFCLDFEGAVVYHPLFWLPVIVLVFFFLRKRYPMLWKAAIITAAAAMICVYFVRMFDSGCSVVVFEPQNNVFNRIAQAFG